MSDSATPWTAAYQAAPSMGFSRQEYWSWLPFPAPRDLPNPGIEPHLLHLLLWQVDSLPLVPPGILFSFILFQQKQGLKTKYNVGVNEDKIF